MFKLAIEIITSDRFDVKAILRLVKLYSEWQIAFYQSVSVFLVMSHSSIWTANGQLVNIGHMPVSTGSLKLSEDRSKKSTFVSHFYYSCNNGPTSGLFFLPSFTVEPSIAVVELTILYSHGVNHGITVKPMVALVLWDIFSIWSISQVNSIDVIWNFSMINSGDFV
jgi:hypothetical protein